MILIVRTETKEKLYFYLKALLVLVVAAFLITQLFSALNSYAVNGKDAKATGYPMRVEQKVLDTQEQKETPKKEAAKQEKTNKEASTVDKAGKASSKANNTQKEPAKGEKETSKKAVEKSASTGGDGLLKTVINQLQEFYRGDK